jgi:hypothetical protein
MKILPLNLGHKSPEMLQALSEPSNREMRHQRFWEASLLSRLVFIKQIGIPRLSPENKGAFLIYHLEQVTEMGGYSLSHTWSHIISLAILTSQAR